MRQTNIRTAEARILRKTQTPAERLLWQGLRNRRCAGAKVRRQVPLGPYTASFYCAEAGLVVHVVTPAEFRHVGSLPEIRAWTETGLRVMSLSETTVLENPSAALRDIAAALRQADPEESS